MRISRLALCTFALASILAGGWYIIEDFTKTNHARGFNERIDSSPIVKKPNEPVLLGTLPAEDIPLRYIIAELRSRAERGDGVAGCRLALEYQRCSLVEQQLNHADDVTAGMTAKNDLPAAALPLDTDGFYASVEHCKSIEVPNANEIAKIWRQAAQNGNLAAMGNYAVGKSFSIGNILDNADEIRIYKNLGPKIARMAIERGDGSTLLSLAAAHQPENQIGLRSFLAQAVTTDVVEALSLFKVAQQELGRQQIADGRLKHFIDTQISKLDRRASIEQQAESDNRAVALRSRVGQIRLPSDNDVPFLSRASAPNIAVTACQK